MLNPKEIAAFALSYAPQFVLSRFSSVITGIIAAYAVLLFFLGHPPFFQRVGELVLVMALGYWGARGARYGIVRLVHLIEGTAPESVAAAATVGGAPEGASNPGSSLGATSSPASLAGSGGRSPKGLD
ncbi:hypothetical protein GH5_05243 [Leishmania sp. Ghana 2012 LV757]|uniref:Uncharacterized protein n=1 Tax=Leishmania orientalis TaxID=2249476 RepID=A0A836HED7_9TRYP|nr:hypothetical protein LSCM4_05226 [Leishmania orientalis]KAG5502270.1 hypothetical protein GH5_05243 [Leishmania sp. Ghana 2012 LV757]